MYFIEKLGEKTINAFAAIFEIGHFTFLICLHLINPKSYNPAMRMVLTKQIYFTAIGVIPVFISMAFLFGSVIIGVVIYLATQYSLQSEIGSIIITFVIDEFAPFFTTLLISLRSGAAINTEIAVMSVNKELNTLKEYNIDLIDYLFLPRIISGIVSIIFLSILFAIIMLTSGYIFTFIYMNMDFNTYKYLLLNAIEIGDIVTLVLKSFAFGFIVMLIPIYSGLKTQSRYTAIPISVLNGMVRLFIAVFLIEVLSLIIQFI